MANSIRDRLHGNDLELGVTEAVQRHLTQHVVPPRPITQRTLDFEHARPRWLRECMAEATGVFFYVFPGIASVAAFTVNMSSPVGVTAFSSLFQIGWCFSLGIAFAIITCAPTSGGHFSPAVTLCFAFWHGFPWRKVPYYIFSQVLGAFLAGMLVMGMYWTQIQELKAAFVAAGKPLVGAGSPASILCAFPNPDQTNMGYVFMIEFFADAFMGVVVWAILDPTNPFVSPAGAPFAVGLAYGATIWGFADVTLSMNLARDLGTRIVAAIFFGSEAFTYMGYPPISILVNVPATFLATAYYEFLMRDSLKLIAGGHAQHAEGEEALMRHVSKTGMFPVESATSHVDGRIDEYNASALKHATD